MENLFRYELDFVLKTNLPPKRESGETTGIAKQPTPFPIVTTIATKTPKKPAQQPQQQHKATTTTVSGGQQPSSNNTVTTQESGKTST